MRSGIISKIILKIGRNLKNPGSFQADLCAKNVAMEKRYYRAILMTSVLAAVITLSLYSLVPVPHKPPAIDALRELSAARYLEQVKYLSRDEMKGRGNGSPELDKAADYIASQFRLWGLRPMGDNNTYFQSFQVTTGAEVGPNNELQLNGSDLRLNEDFVPILFSDTAQVDGPLVFAGYGITASELHYDDYQGIDVSGKIVVVMRQADEGGHTSHFTTHASLIDKAINAKQHGAK